MPYLIVIKQENIDRVLNSCREAQESLQQEHWWWAKTNLEIAIETLLADCKAGPASERAEVVGTDTNQNNGNSGFAGGCTWGLAGCPDNYNLAA